MQSSSDIFLGWVRGKRGYDFYVRQLRDMKMSVPLEELSRSASTNTQTVSAGRWRAPTPSQAMRLCVLVISGRVTGSTAPW
jgi:hypothetical protein